MTNLILEDGMILTDIKKNLIKKGPMTIASLSSELGQDRDMVQAGIEHWIQRGSVEEVNEQGSCSSCSGCGCGDSQLSTLQPKLYRWEE